MRTDRTEQDWIERAKQGDLEAFECLYRAHVRQIYGLCRRLLGTTQDADDITQSAFLKAWRSIKTFRGESQFGTWLRRIALHQVIDERKSAWRRYLENPVDDSIERVAVRSAATQDRIDLEQAISLLPTGSRQVLVLHDVEGYTHAEIAKLLGVTPGTTKTQLFRARRALKELLG